VLIFFPLHGLSGFILVYSLYVSLERRADKKSLLRETYIKETSIVQKTIITALPFITYRTITRVMALHAKHLLLEYQTMKTHRSILR